MKKSNIKVLKSIAIILFLTCCWGVSFAQVFWSEDFTNGIPADWTNVDLENNNGEWTWCDDPLAQPGTGCPGISNGQLTFGATTAETGFITVASDAIGSTNTSSHTSELTTSAIDCSAYSEVYLSFETTIGIYILPADENVFLQVSTDGIVWEDYIIFPLLSGQDEWSDNPEFIVFNLSNIAAGKSTVYLRWLWQAGWEFYWNLDDIALSVNNPLPPHDLRVNTNWFATALNSMVPASQVDTFGFMADVENIGSEDQTNVLLNMTIVDNSDPTTPVYNQTLGFGTIPVGGLVGNELFPDDGFTPLAVSATYTATYSVSGDSTDADLGDNTINFVFEVSDTIFAKDAGLANAAGGAPPLTVWTPGESYSWAYGNYFYTPNGSGMYATKASFALANASDPGIAGEQVNIRLYKWIGDADGGEDVDPDEREWIGYAIYSIVGDEPFNEMITVSILNPSTNLPNIELEDNGEYILMLEYAATDQTLIAFMLTQDIDYAPAIYRSQQLGTPRYASMIAFGDPISSEAFNSFGFGRDVVPVVRLHISDNPGVVNVKDILDDNNIVEVFPNPASEYIYVNIELANIHTNVVIEITDANGKLIEQRSYNDFQKEQLKVELNKLTAGSYFLNVSTPDGQKSTAFSVVR